MSFTLEAILTDKSDANLIGVDNMISGVVLIISNSAGLWFRINNHQFIGWEHFLFKIQTYIRSAVS